MVVIRLSLEQAQVLTRTMQYALKNGVGTDEQRAVFEALLRQLAACGLL